MPRNQSPTQIQVSFIMDRNDHKIVVERAKELNLSLAQFFKTMALKGELHSLPEEK